MASIRKRHNHYHVQIRRRGHTVTRSFDKLAAAKTWVAQTEGDIERCLYLDTSGLERLAVSELLDRYEKEVLPTHRGGQVEAYRIRHLRRHLGNLRLIHLTPKVLAEYRDTRLLSITPASLKCEFTILNRVLSIAVKDWGIALPQNPVQMISLPKADKARTRRLEAGEEHKLVLGWNAEVGRIIVLALETGMRRGEILSVKKNHIDFSLRTLFIPSTKTDSPRTVPLSSAAINSLRAQLRASQRHSGGVVSLIETPLFTYTPRGLTGAFLKLCRKTGIDDLHFHDLRHEATSRFFEKGLNPVEVATITGHKDTRMLMRYTHLRAEDLVKRLG